MFFAVAVSVKLHTQQLRLMVHIYKTQNHIIIVFCFPRKRILLNENHKAVYKRGRFAPQIRCTLQYNANGCFFF